MQVTDSSTIEKWSGLLTDEYSRRILLATMNQPKSVTDISRESNISMSTCYRRVTEMVECGALIAQKVVITPEGKKCELYRSAFKGLRMVVDLENVSLEAVVNEDIADRLYNVWNAMRWNSTR